ncbi:hypothetical protein FRC17_008301, partial [Serendipita sp. 399]
TTAPPESLAAAYIASRLEECLHKVALIRSISEDALPAEETSAKILAISRCSEALPPIDIDETFLNVLNLDTVLDFVLSLAADPLGTDVGAYIAKGVLHKVADTLKVHGTVQYYVREYPFPDARVFVHQMQTYALTFPHDSPWALSSLIVAGYPQAATELLQTLAETIGATIPSICLLQFKRPSQLSLKYIGMTSAQTLHERSHDDLGGATTRLRNFSKCNGWDQEDVLIFEIPSLALTNVDAFAERTDARVGPREEWLIGRLPVGLNVAPGHVKLFFDAPPDIRDCFARIERRGGGRREGPDPVLENWRFLDDPKTNPTSIKGIANSPALNIHLPSKSRTTVHKLT